MSYCCCFHALIYQIKSQRVGPNTSANAAKKMLGRDLQGVRDEKLVKVGESGGSDLATQIGSFSMMNDDGNRYMMMLIVFQIGSAHHS